MKKSIHLLTIGLPAALSLWSSTSSAAVDPSKLLVTIYGVAVSTTTDCSNPIVLFDAPAGIETDFLNKPVIGGGDIPDGTYPCVMINMSDVIRFVPSANEGSDCVAGTTYSIDVCRSDNGCTFDIRNGTTFSSGNSAHGTNTSPSSDIVTLFLTTNSAAGGSNNFQKPTSTSDTTRGLPLGSAFVVSGTSAGKFTVNAQGRILSSGGQCGMNPPAFSFQ
jgi:hypothetical protein